MSRVVVKVGSAVLTENGTIALERMQALVDFLAELKEMNEVILVSSGAVAAGYTQLQLDRTVLENKQALASIGQPVLMDKYAKKFAKHTILTAQVLVTAANFSKKDDIQRIKNTVDTLLKNCVIPIVNENDATATEELVLGDNDQLSAYITNHMNADILVILSDIDAYYESDPRVNPHAKILKVVETIPESELEKIATPNNFFATGGIVTKLKAASYLLACGKSMFLSSGFNLKDVKSFMIEQKHLGGTLFTKESI
ncbi:MAG: glutamate 5-kinase [Epsilonproteobacteria bacterium]|nr:glutamate 5-kinase [Campylobacterota bacterium]NCO26028.1 glutamate 5-kinase [Campylobacterota bacterium]OIO14393.1 MAG: glutamate 5-kinase [Helicobacteraceae bacterium CG1_02_36_14]PIW25211.1 MAG: glutamate 5-kinase [Sulfurimonas sp. CG15_BIG_FIL_POST_REV_8_21_14_020_36_339]PJE70422.1 MAG: glutamate 5-kinase [Sulfurimonas sp. CG10_big_fil_rev_8_21_14_0_10_36_24]